jgi:type I restriction enzyme S subunit
VLEVLEESVRTNGARAQRLRQAILKHAFGGKLVPQDPTDEPASVLLARIRASRASVEQGSQRPKPARRLPARRKPKVVSREVRT